jgi:hypothetical protein
MRRFRNFVPQEAFRYPLPKCPGIEYAQSWRLIDRSRREVSDPALRIHTVLRAASLQWARLKLNCTFFRAVCYNIVTL